MFWLLQNNYEHKHYYNIQAQCLFRKIFFLQNSHFIKILLSPPHLKFLADFFNLGCERVVLLQEKGQSQGQGLECIDLVYASTAVVKLHSIYSYAM